MCGVCSALEPHIYLYEHSWTLELILWLKHLEFDFKPKISFVSLHKDEA